MSIDNAYKQVCVPMSVPKGRYCVVIGSAGAIICDQYDMEGGFCRAGYETTHSVQGMVAKPEECYDLPTLLHKDQ